MSATEAPSVGPGRHEARQRVVELLYGADLRGMTARDLLDSLVLEPVAYAQEAVTGIEATLEDVDQLIEEFAHGWSLHRMPPVDRAVLRLAVWELRERPDVPTAVVIDEAVELAREYSTEQAQAFVNGVLDAVARAVRR